MKLNFVLSFLIFHFGVIYGFNTINEDFDFNIAEIHKLIRSKKYNCTDVVNYFIERSVRYNPILNAIISYSTKAFEEALNLDEYFYKNGKFIGKLHCIPFLVKDNIDVKGIPTTGGIKALRYSIPNIDADVVEKIKIEGAIVISKANLAELAAVEYNSEMGGACKNPWDFTRTCGSSSSGSGAGIAASMAVVSLGTDTEGSIMNPSTVNGLFGLRPAVGDLSLSGIIPNFVLQDTVGPLAKYLDDVVLSYSIMADKQSVYNEYQTATSKKFKVGYLDRFFSRFALSNQYGNFTYIIDDQVNVLLTQAVENLKKLNIDVVKVEMTDDEFDKLITLILQIIMTREATLNACLKTAMNKYFGDNDRFGPDSPYHSFESLIDSSILSNFWKQLFTNLTSNTEETCETFLSSYDFVRFRLIQLFDVWYQRGNIDILIFPTLTDLPYKLDAVVTNISPVFFSPYLGYPSLNVPIGFTNATQEAPEGLPAGLLMLPKKKLLDTFKIAKVYENNYMKSRKLPKSTPLISDKCFDSATSFSLVIKKNNIFTILALLTCTIFKRFVS